MTAYYNEWDSFAADWLRELIKDKLIPEGVVDTRSIADVEPADIKEFTQCHFFAGIGGWSRALHLAGWSAERPVWTGSPPCQPFSTAGKQSGKDDLRHLWPAFFNLIRECSPPTIFGEQVASAIRFGWLDDLQRDLEAEGYAAAAVVLPSGAVSAPHKRDRLFFVADSNASQCQREWISGGVNQKNSPTRSDEAYNFWDKSEIVYCQDGKHRPIPTEPALFPLANGVPNRVGILRGAGNAIVPQAAAEIIKAYMEQDN